MKTALGISQSEAERLFKQYGPNEIPVVPPPSPLQLFTKQFSSPMVILLLAAAGVTLALQDWHDGIVILLAAGINGVVGFFQESKASHEIEALKKMLVARAKVIRGGEVRELTVREIVPGDVVVLAAGEKIPADGVLMEAYGLQVSEAILTGESVPVEKSAVDSEQLSVISGQLSDAGLSVAGLSETGKPKTGYQGTENRRQRTDNWYVFMGTSVMVGRGTMLVVRTGLGTEMGKVAEMLKETKPTETPLQKKITRLARELTIIAIVVSLIVFGLLFFNGWGLTHSFTVAVAIAVATIPEGLAVSLTVVFALGMSRIFRRRALVRSLLAAETLGSVTVIATDKTGTLTEGKMKVTAPETSDKRALITAAVLSNNLLTPTEIAAWEWARSVGETDPQKIFEDNPRLAEVPFSSEQKYMATLNNLKSQNSNLKTQDDKLAIFVKGAPDIILNWCKLSIDERAEWDAKIGKLSREGLRLLGFAEKSLEQTLSASVSVCPASTLSRPVAFATGSLEQSVPTHLRPAAPGNNESLLSANLNSGFKFLGLLGLTDPVRPEVKAALAEVERAGIKTLVLTGDYRETAEAVMRQIGWEITPEQIMEGYELEKIDPLQLQARLPGVRLFARITPSDKLKLVAALQAGGEVVAMTGDGVNDAPALKKADIGVVVEPAAAVAREVGDLILLDSNFATIVAAVEEGRSIFANSRKVILYLFSNSVIEVAAIIGSIFLGLPLPLTAAQILWINLIHDVLPSLALTFEPKDPNLLREKPRRIEAGLMNSQMRSTILMLNAIVPAVLLLTLWLFYRQSSSLPLAQSVVFALLTLCVLFGVFSLRSLTTPIWKMNPFSNPYLFGSVVFGIIALLSALYFPPLSLFLGLRPLTGLSWVYVFGMSALVIGFIESAKLLFLRHAKRD